MNIGFSEPERYKNSGVNWLEDESVEGPPKRFSLTRINEVLLAGEGKVMLAGGAMRPGKPADYDFFFKDIDASIYAEAFFRDIGAKTKFVCPEGLLTTLEYRGNKIQLITERFYKSMEELIDTFDLIPCCAATDWERSVRHYLFNDLVEKKEVKLHRITYPVSTLARLVRYAGKGYKVAPKVVEQVVNYLLAHPDASRRLYID